MDGDRGRNKRLAVYMNWQWARWLDNYFTTLVVLYLRVLEMSM